MVLTSKYSKSPIVCNAYEMQTPRGDLRPAQGTDTACQGCVGCNKRQKAGKESKEVRREGEQAKECSKVKIKKEVSKGKREKEKKGAQCDITKGLEGSRDGEKGEEDSRIKL